MRFKIGDKVKKKLRGEILNCVIANTLENIKFKPCGICSDKHCKQWNTLRVIGKNAGESLYHVSECELEKA